MNPMGWGAEFTGMLLLVERCPPGQTLLGSNHKGRRHIHDPSFDRCALRRRERFKQTLGSLQSSIRHQIENPRAVNVGQDAGLAVALLGTLIIYSQIGSLFLGATQHASLSALTMMCLSWHGQSIGKTGFCWNEWKITVESMKNRLLN